MSQFINKSRVQVTPYNHPQTLTLSCNYKFSCIYLILATLQNKTQGNTINNYLRNNSMLAIISLRNAFYEARKYCFDEDSLQKSC